MKARSSIWLIVLANLVLVALFVRSGARYANAQGPAVKGPFVGRSIRATSFDGDVRNLPQILSTEGIVFDPPRAVPNEKTSLQPSPAQLDPVLQTRRAPAGMPGPIQNFQGLDRVSWGAGWPPDPNGDVGPNHYIQTVNTSIGIYNKTGTQLAICLQ